jgi:hypothetical protein
MAAQKLAQEHRGVADVGERAEGDERPKLPQVAPGGDQQAPEDELTDAEEADKVAGRVGPAPP